MAKYPISIQDSLHDGKLGPAFANLLKLHVKPWHEILDPTAGSRLLWEGIPLDKYHVYFSDIQGDNGNIKMDLREAGLRFALGSFDAVVFDPPYFIGKSKTKDPREDKYGGYVQSYEELRQFIQMCTHPIWHLLKPGGKLIVKCSDQYSVPERKIYTHHIDWAIKMQEHYEIVDIMIYRHHRISPTAFQVKNRPCSVIMHTYFIVGRKIV